MVWHKSLSTFIWIFPVGRGNAAFLRTGLNQGFILDMAGGEFCDPAGFVKKHFVPKLDRYPEKDGHKIAQGLLSHAHSDHIAQCGELESDDLYPTLLTCPHDKTVENHPDERLNWKRIVNPGGTERLIDTYKGLYKERQLPLQTIRFDSRRDIPNLEYGLYYVRPPICEKLHESNDNDYGNATSIMLYYRHGNHTVLFPGDMTPEGMRHILTERNGIEKRFTKFNARAAQTYPTWHERTGNQPSLMSLLQQFGLSILVAPHHGLESCYSTDLYAAIKGGKPQLVVVSERRHKKPNDGKVDSRYQSEAGATGFGVEIEGKVEMRRSISTVDGLHILIVFAGTGTPRVYAHKDPEALLRKLG